MIRRAIFLAALLITLAHCEVSAQWVRDTVLYPLNGVWGMVILEDTLYASSHGTILRSTDEGSNWQSEGNGLIPGYAYWPFVGVGHFLLTRIAKIGSPDDTNFGKFFSSIDAGSSWKQLNVAPLSLGLDALIAVGNTFYLPGVAGLLRSTDGGATWTVATTEINSGLLAGSHVNCFLQWGGKIFAGSDTGIFVTRDSGQTWELVPSIDTLREVRSLELLDSYIFVAAKDSIYRSLDSGRNWENISAPFPALMPNYSFGMVDGNLLFCNGFAALIYRSGDRGNSWTYFGQGMDSATVLTAFAYTEHSVYAVEVGEYLYRRPLSDFGISSVAQTPATKPEIQSYPNPFSQRATITFTSEAESYADVRVVNLLGAEVAQLFSGEVSAGEHEFSWDASGFAPGMYECVVRVNGRVQRISMAHVR